MRCRCVPTVHIQCDAPLLRQRSGWCDGDVVHSAVLQQQVPELQRSSTSVQRDPAGVVIPDEVFDVGGNDVCTIESPADGKEGDLRRTQVGGEPHRASHGSAQGPRGQDALTFTRTCSRFSLAIWYVFSSNIEVKLCLIEDENSMLPVCRSSRQAAVQSVLQSMLSDDSLQRFPDKTAEPRLLLFYQPTPTAWPQPTTSLIKTGDAVCSSSNLESPLGVCLAIFNS